MMDLTNKTIEKIFYEKMRQKTMQSMEQSFDYQFSDEWNNDVFKNRFRLTQSKTVCL